MCGLQTADQGMGKFVSAMTLTIMTSVWKWYGNFNIIFQINAVTCGGKGPQFEGK